MATIIALLIIITNIVIATAELWKIGMARVLAIARKLVIAWATMTMFVVFVVPRIASASGLEVVVEAAIDANGELQFYDGSDRIDGSLSIDSLGEPVLYVFCDVQDGGETWQLDIIDPDPSAAVTCERGEGVLECEHDGSTEVELLIEATSQQTGAKKRKPLVIKPPPETQPASATAPPS